MGNDNLQKPESHPFEPFLPDGAGILMLGSFPPQPKRWCMDFYYPNFSNDMWRIFGIVFFGDREHFIMDSGKRRTFDKELVMRFCTEKGIAMYDAAHEVIRLKDNASDKFLKVAVGTDIEALLRKIPGCRAIVATGQKAADVLVERFGCPEPQMGGFSEFDITIEPGLPRRIRLYRMPSSSRAYPLSIDRKAEAYRKMFAETGLI